MLFAEQSPPRCSGSYQPEALIDQRRCSPGGCRSTFLIIFCLKGASRFQLGLYLILGATQQLALL